jgi:translation initiation factor 3 subunit K
VLYSLNSKFIRVQILIKALMALPDTDYMLCTYLIPVSIQSDPSIAALKSLADQLESCSFQKFWSEVSSSSALLSTVPGFDDAIRKFILSVVSVS